MKQKVLGGRSYANGIKFFTEKKTCRVIVDEKGIHTVVKKQSVNTLVVAIAFCIAIILAVVRKFGGYEEIIITFTKQNITAILYHASICFIPITVVSYIATIIYANTHGKELRKYHAAEHMAVMQYMKLGRVPTIEETKDTTFISKNCGSNSIGYELGLQLYFIIMYHINKSIDVTPYFAGLAIVIVALIVLHNLKVFTIFQIPLTKKPEVRHIEVAIKALKECDDSN